MPREQSSVDGPGSQEVEPPAIGQCDHGAFAPVCSSSFRMVRPRGDALREIEDSMPRLSLGDLLSFFPANDLSRALARAGVRGGGTRIERLERLRTAARQAGVSANQVLECFSAESLRRVGTRFGIRVPSKAELIASLVAALTEPFPPPALQVATTIESIRAFVLSLAGSHRGLRSEADAECFLASALADHFAEVRTQVKVPGHLGHRIDIDIQSGRFGVEVKLASAVVESSSEAYRLLGQAFYYDRRRYAGRLLVVVVGPEALGRHPVIREVFDLLGVIGVTGVCLPMN